MVHVQTDPGTRAWPVNTDSRSPFDSPGDACRLDCFEMCVQRSRHASMECGSSAQPTHCLFPTCDQSREMHEDWCIGCLNEWLMCAETGDEPLSLASVLAGAGGAARMARRGMAGNRETLGRNGISWSQGFLCRSHARYVLCAKGVCVLHRTCA
jgi:hypothetical protein